jgi:hypothetical protein
MRISNRTLIFSGGIALSLLLFVIGYQSLQAAHTQKQLSQSVSSSVLTPHSKIGSYSVQDPHYFSGGWVVATIQPGDTSNDPAIFIAQKDQTGQYQLKLGPGTSFSTDTVRGLPSDVVQYLASQNLLSVPGGEN